MRVAILTSYFFHQVAELNGEDRIVFGGAERYQVELCRLMRDLGHEVTVYQALPNSPAGVKPRQVTKEHEGVQIICLPIGSPSKLGVNAELNTVFNEHASLFDLRIYMVTHLAFPHAVRPAITISHGIYWDYPQSEYRLLDEAERVEWRRRNLYGFTAADVCVAVDSNVRRVLQAMEPGAESRVQVIPNFVDTTKFQPNDRFVRDAGGPVVLYPRRLTSLRGSNDFLRATRDYPQYRYVACGQASDAATEAQARDWAPPHVNFIWRPMEEMPAVYQQADIAVVPTKAAEGLSLSLLEAMATGLPIITTPVGGIGDATIDGYNALVYDPNHEDLGEYIHALAQDPDMRRRFGERNREIAVESFDLQRWRARWQGLLQAFQ